MATQTQSPKAQSQVDKDRVEKGKAACKAIYFAIAAKIPALIAFRHLVSKAKSNAKAMITDKSDKKLFDVILSATVDRVAQSKFAENIRQDLEDAVKALQKANIAELAVVLNMVDKANRDRILANAEPESIVNRRNDVVFKLVRAGLGDDFKGIKLNTDGVMAKHVRAAAVEVISQNGFADDLLKEVDSLAKATYIAWSTPGCKTKGDISSQVYAQAAMGLTETRAQLEAKIVQADAKTFG